MEPDGPDSPLVADTTDMTATPGRFAFPQPGQVDANYGAAPAPTPSAPDADWMSGVPVQRTYERGTMAQQPGLASAGERNTNAHGNNSGNHDAAAGAGAGAGAGFGGMHGNPLMVTTPAMPPTMVEVPIHPKHFAEGIVPQANRVLRYTPSHSAHKVPAFRFHQGASMPIKIAIVVTMYSEDPDELSSTLEGIAQNISHMQSKGRPWQQVCVIIVSDGLQKINSETFRRAEEMGIAKQSMISFAEHLGAVNTQHVKLHEYSSTVQLRPTTAKMAKKYGSHYAPMQTIFAIKHHNNGKLDSHKWFFEAYCSLAKPDFVLLVDVGTRPGPESIHNLVECMAANPEVAGCCGEIRVSLPPGHETERYTKLVVAAQQFEYTIAHCLDKPLESFLGFITVLPGAFSAYRYGALIGDGVNLRSSSSTPLDKYFAPLNAAEAASTSGETADPGIFNANMYLAEDRILCFELVAQPGRNYQLKFVKNSPAFTDVPMTLMEWTRQRRRWLNGSLFALIHALLNYRRILSGTAHSTGRKALLAFEFLYLVLMVMGQWLLIGTFYLTFKLSLSATLTGTVGEVAVLLMSGAWLLVAALVMVLSLGNDSSSPRVRGAFRLASGTFGVLFAVATLATVYYVAADAAASVIFGSVAFLAIFVLASLLHGDTHRLLCVLPQYLVMLPTFIVSFTIYSLANIDDVSWGTKNITQVQSHLHRLSNAPPPKPFNEMSAQEFEAYNRQATQKADAERALMKQVEAAETAKQQNYRWHRSVVVMSLLACNWVYVALVSDLISRGHELQYVALVVVYLAFMIGVKFLGSVAFQCQRLCCSRRARSMNGSAV